MSGNSLKFRKGIPEGCPEPLAEAKHKWVYRAIRSVAPTPFDFESEAERRKYKDGSGNCVAWGLSAWVSLDAVVQARKIVPGFDRKCIVGFDATPADGVIAGTPTLTQPEHHTFWKAVDVDLCPRCTIEVERSLP